MEIEKIMATDAYQKACKAESLAYLCYSIGNQAREQADEYLDKVGLKVYDIKYLANHALKSFERYHNCVKSTILKDSATFLCDDYEKVRHALYVFAGLEDGDTESGAPSCSAENNDQIAFGNNSNVGDKK